MMTFWFWIQTAILVAIAGGYVADKMSDKFAKKVSVWLGGGWDEEN